MKKAIFLMLILAISTISNSCADDDKIDKVTKAILLTIVGYENVITFDEEYSSITVDPAYLDFFAKSNDGSSISISLHKGEHNFDGEQSLNPETDKVEYFDKDNNPVIMNEGTYNINPETKAGIINCKDGSGQEYKVEVGKEI